MLICFHTRPVHTFSLFSSVLLYGQEILYDSPSVHQYMIWWGGNRPIVYPPVLRPGTFCLRFTRYPLEAHSSIHGDTCFARSRVENRS
jgi:hypothetical protein